MDLRCPDSWLENHFKGEFFSGNFSHLLKAIKTLGLKEEFHPKIITVGGTNGKGQTSRFLESLMAKSDINCALWSSPHIESVCERFSFNTISISKDELYGQFEEFHHSFFEVELSYYEFLFLNFMLLAKKKKVDFIILEVGLGGRLDAVNSFDADLSIITSISRDHQEILGHTYKEILFEKLGISRAGKPLITALENSYLRQMTSAYAKENKVFWSDLFETEKLLKKDNYIVRNLELSLSALSSLGIKLKPSFDKRSFLNENKKVFGLGGAQFELFPSHNPDGVRKLVQFLEDAKYNYELCVVAFSKRSLKDARCMMKSLINFFGAENIRLCFFTHDKSMAEQDVVLIGKEFDVQIIFDIEEDFEKLSKSFNKVLITGSNYFTGSFLSYYN